MSFFPVSSGFRWLSDLERGIVLEGEIEGFPAVAAVSFLADTEGDTEALTAKYRGAGVDFMLGNELVECRTFSGQQPEEGLFIVGLQEVAGAGEKASSAEPDSSERGIFGAEIYLDTGGERVDPGIIAASESLRILLERELIRDWEG